jgi:hypothetical protein
VTAFGAAFLLLLCLPESIYLFLQFFKLLLYFTDVVLALLALGLLLFVSAEVAGAGPSGGLVEGGLEFALRGPQF